MESGVGQVTPCPIALSAFLVSVAGCECRHEPWPISGGADRYGLQRNVGKEESSWASPKGAIASAFVSFHDEERPLPGNGVRAVGGAAD